MTPAPVVLEHMCLEGVECKDGEGGEHVVAGVGQRQRRAAAGVALTAEKVEVPSDCCECLWLAWGGVCGER